MKGKSGYPVACKGKDTVINAAKARKAGGRVFGGNISAHKAKDIGALPDGASGGTHAGKVNRGVHGKPLMSASAGCGTQPKGHKTQD